MAEKATVKQFYDKALSHSSYAILSAGEMILVDPARDPRPYFDYAAEQQASIRGVIETHPHADFVSGHLEIHRATGAFIYASKLTGALYPHLAFDEGDEITLGSVILQAINTPGHSPDSICILLVENCLITAVFTGDTLFAGDVGRPDLRETAGKIVGNKEELAVSLYRSLREKLMTLPAATIVYPAHGPGSLCGKHLSPELSSTIGREIAENYALQGLSEQDFVQLILEDQPFVPQYFPFDVELNRKGAAAFGESVQAVKRLGAGELEIDVMTIDSRPAELFRSGHVENAVNIPFGNSFQTWLGTLVAPGERFSLIVATEQDIEPVLERIAGIGYETNITGCISGWTGGAEEPELDLELFRKNPSGFTILDVRNDAEVKNGPVFASALHIPLSQLRQRLGSVPKDKPVVVHCAGGSRSAIGASLVTSLPGVEVYDLGKAVREFK